MYRFLFFYANMIVNKNEVLNKVKLKLTLHKAYRSSNKTEITFLYAFRGQGVLIHFVLVESRIVQFN